MAEQNNTIDNDSQKSWKLTLVVLILAAVVAITGYAAVSYHRMSEYQALLPQHQIPKIETEFLKFRKVFGAFPKDFAEINNKVWHKVPGSHLNDDPTTWQKDHYYYRIVSSGNQMAIWAIPLGDRRTEASTYFLVISPEWRRAWKGPAMDSKLLGKLRAVPNASDLAAVGLEEQKAFFYPK